MMLSCLGEESSRHGPLFWTWFRGVSKGKDTLSESPKKGGARGGWGPLKGALPLWGHKGDRRGTATQKRERGKGTEKAVIDRRGRREDEGGRRKGRMEGSEGKEVKKVIGRR